MVRALEYLLVIFLTWLVCSFIYSNKNSIKYIDKEIVIRDTVELKGDSIPYPKLVYEKIYDIRWDTIRDTIYLDSIIRDYYAERIYESIYSDSLVDLNIKSYISNNRLNGTTISGQIYKETIVREKIINDAKRINWGIGVGVGYGFINKKPDVFAGASLNYNF